MSSFQEIGLICVRNFLLFLITSISLTGEVLFNTISEYDLSSGIVVLISVPEKRSRYCWAFSFDIAVFNNRSVTTRQLGDAFRKALLNCFQLSCFDTVSKDIGVLSMISTSSIQRGD